jgi:uncharacterized protein YhhL (DUF1145 family)
MFTALSKQLAKYCPPAQLYLILSVTAVLLMVIENIGCRMNEYRVASYSCDLDFPNVVVFVAKIAYIAIWTIILNSLCKSGYTPLAWFLVLAPLVVFLLLIVLLVLLMRSSKQGKPHTQKDLARRPVGWMVSA